MFADFLKLSFYHQLTFVSAVQHSVSRTGRRGRRLQWLTKVNIFKLKRETIYVYIYHITVALCLPGWAEVCLSPPSLALLTLWEAIYPGTITDFLSCYRYRRRENINLLGGWIIVRWNQGSEIRIFLLIWFIPIGGGKLPLCNATRQVLLWVTLLSWWKQIKMRDFRVLKVPYTP